MDDPKTFFNLLNYSNRLKRNKKYLNKEEPETFDRLLKFLVRIENNLHYSENQEYIKLAKNFLADKITAADFSYSFMAIYEAVSRKLTQMKANESLELANFLKSSRPELVKLFARIYGSYDSYSPDPKVEIAIKELKDYAQILLFKLQED